MSGVGSAAAVLCAALEAVPASPRDLSYLLEDLGSVGRLVDGPLQLPSGRSRALAVYVRSRMTPERLAFWAREIEKVSLDLPDLKFMSVIDGSYPDRVRRAYDRPPFVFFRGTLPTGRATAIVGSRVADQQTLDWAKDLSGRLAQEGHTIVSGLASGVDTAAHSGCLRAGGPTVAVLGHGIAGPLYPPENAGLAESVAASGALVSQFPPSAPPTSSSFVTRNALISAFAEVTVVLSAQRQSGSRSALESALAQGRRVVVFDRLIGRNRWLRTLIDNEPMVTAVSSLDDVTDIVHALDGS